MPTREHVTALLDQGHSYETAARTLGVPAGQAFMTATGVPADGSDAPSRQWPEAAPLLPGGSQALVGPPPFHPTRKASVMAWVRERAAREMKGTR